MPVALSIAWRLLLAVALIVSPILGLASDGGCAMGTHAGASQAAAQVAQAMPEAMPGCTHMADMAPAKAPHSKPDPARTAPGHGACTSSACCLGGAVGMLGVSLVIAAPTTQLPHADFHDATAPTPPSGRMLRPPIA